MSPEILVVDDSLTVRMDLTEALRTAGLLATPCATLGEARARLASAAIAVVILDLVLPDGDGLQLLREIKAHSATIAVVLLSSEAEVRDRVRGLTTGADEYVGKPYDLGYLIARVRELTRRAYPDQATPGALLLIDDSLTFRETLGRALRHSGHSVITAGTGEEGLRLAASERPRAVIVDGQLPGIDGASVIRHIRLDAALRGIPCVLLTAARELDAELRALDAGADAFVHKDQDVDVILAKLHAALRSTAEPKPAEMTASLLAPKRILTVDDDPDYGELLAAALRAEGNEVILARTGEEALELLAVQPVDCVLMDVMMPGIGGKETCRRLKQSPMFRDIPVVLLSSAEDRHAVLEGLGAGADDYLLKSAELEVIKARVRAQLRRRQFEDETRRVRDRLLKSELEASEARAAREIAETRAAFVGELERKHRDLEAAYAELKETQSQLVQAAKMASLGSLVAGVAHEINNPLAFALSHLGTAEQGLAEVEMALGAATFTPVRKSWDRSRDRLAGMRLGLERIRDLVLKLRTFSRLDEGEIKTVSFRECVQSVLTILEHRLGDRVTVTTELGPPDIIECMPGLLNQALMNLIVNALDAIEGDGTIRVASGAEGDSFVIRVEDSGKGIPLALRERVLEPFFSTKPVGQGTGLGLSITYSIVKKHGGRLELGDAPGGGTAAVILLPLVPSPATQT
ncbi:MAG TPA: response regulator [Polyangiaceae bacterium]|nr:response regulator [Polyangiaceae bacterium]